MSRSLGAARGSCHTALPWRRGQCVRDGCTCRTGGRSWRSPVAEMVSNVIAVGGVHQPPTTHDGDAHAGCDTAHKEVCTTNAGCIASSMCITNDLIWAIEAIVETLAAVCGVPAGAGLVTRRTSFVRRI